MTCRHAKDDPQCSSHPDHARYMARMTSARAEANQPRRQPETPDKERYEIVRAERVGRHLVLKVTYPNCWRCSYEGNKVMVFLDVTEQAALLWRVIDPHFREDKPTDPHAAPGPAARFPASDEGWRDAIEYAKRKDAGGEGEGSAWHR